MAKLSSDETKKLARLSKIALTDDEVEKFRNELGSILEHIDKLDKIDTNGVEPTYQVTGLRNVTRADEVKDYGTDKQDLLSNVAETEDGMIKVPKVL